MHSYIKFTGSIIPSIIKYVFFCLFLTRQPPVGQGFSIHEVSRSHTHHSR